MADIPITAPNVRPGAAGAVVRTVGETITAGQTLYKKASDDKMYKADCNDTTETATLAGVAATNAAADEVVLVMTSGTYVCGGTVVKGESYVVSATAGGLAPIGDGASGWRTSVVGVATSTTEIAIAINNTDVARI